MVAENIARAKRRQDVIKPHVLGHYSQHYFRLGACRHDRASHTVDDTPKRDGDAALLCRSRPYLPNLSYRKALGWHASPPASPHDREDQPVNVPESTTPPKDPTPLLPTAWQYQTCILACWKASRHHIVPRRGIHTEVLERGIKDTGLRSGRQQVASDVPEGGAEHHHFQDCLSARPAANKSTFPSIAVATKHLPHLASSSSLLQAPSPLFCSPLFLLTLSTGHKL